MASTEEQIAESLPGRSGEARCWKGPVMTVEIEPAQTEVVEKKKTGTKTFAPEQERRRSISLWDERAAKVGKRYPVRPNAKIKSD